LTFLELKPNINFDGATTDNTNVSDFIGETQQRSLSTIIRNTSESKGVTSNSEALLRRKFKKPKRELELKYIMNFSDNETNGDLYNTSAYDYTSILDTNFQQKKKNNNSSINHYGILTYTEPITKKIKTQFEYLY
jgi:hypothetical protein